MKTLYLDIKSIIWAKGCVMNRTNRPTVWVHAFISDIPAFRTGERHPADWRKHKAEHEAPDHLAAADVAYAHSANLLPALQAAPVNLYG